ncbi:hypothetical protein QEH42_gp192 [Microbacterium phage Pumpernickel]|uniref:Uncharacterized protein n=1 Tax=Microbacterium phage Pumpernickel TaxID=2885983 RepID=A0AAE8Y8R3_9CAUD|nr:hypothetical protein QEH42_gp192 [Microbacterium phage Pumpernickel]UDL16026.1 hypothetical protein SEA_PUMPERNICKEL_276 [Microbacterium phage Pumpernickel]
MVMNEFEKPPYGRSFKIMVSGGGYVTLNRNQQARHVNQDTLGSPLGRAFIIAVRSADYYSENYVVVSDDDMQDLFRAYLKVREDIENIAEENEPT